MVRDKASMPSDHLLLFPENYGESTLKLLKELAWNLIGLEIHVGDQS